VIQFRTEADLLIAASILNVEAESVALPLPGILPWPISFRPVMVQVKEDQTESLEIEVVSD
jgi:hypothetical protein